MVPNRLRSQNGLATVEFAFIVAVVALLVFGIIEFGSLIQAQAVVTNISREGGNLASRDIAVPDEVLDLLAESSSPLDFPNNPTQYRIYITQVNSGEPGNPEPQCPADQEGGLLAGNGVIAPSAEANCGLTADLWEYLRYDQNVGAAPLGRLTVVKVYYNHQPITPLARIMQSAGGGTFLNFDSGSGSNDSVLLESRAIF